MFPYEIQPISHFQLAELPWGDAPAGAGKMGVARLGNNRQSALLPYGVTEIKILRIAVGIEILIK